MTFHVGQKVVCVDDTGVTDTGLRAGCIYTVDELWPENFWGNFGLSVVEIQLAETPTTRPAFKRTRFRPAVEKKTDIAIFTNLLTPNPQRRELVSSVIGESIDTL